MWRLLPSCLWRLPPRLQEWQDASRFVLHVARLVIRRAGSRTKGMIGARDFSIQEAGLHALSAGGVRLQHPAHAGAFGVLIKGQYTLGFGDVLDYLNLIFEAMSFWLIWQRKAAARSLIMAFSLFNIVIGTGYNLGQGGFDPLNQLLSSLFDIVLFLYFLTSRRVKAVLTERSRRGEARGACARDQLLSAAHLGVLAQPHHVLLRVQRGGALDGGRILHAHPLRHPARYLRSELADMVGLALPLPVYGVGAVACVLLLYPVKNFLEQHIGSRVVPLLISFVVNALVCTLIELAMGLMLNQPLPDGSLPLWDYRDMFCNLHGPGMPAERDCVRYRGDAHGPGSSIRPWNRGCGSFQVTS